MVFILLDVLQLVGGPSCFETALARAVFTDNEDLMSHLTGSTVAIAKNKKLY